MVVQPTIATASQGAPGKPGPAVVAFSLSKASARELHQKNVAQPRPLRPEPPARDLSQGVQGLSRHFFGASSVASALDLRGGRDPAADREQSITAFLADRPKEELSTLQRRGTFYFALTGRFCSLTPGVVEKYTPSRWSQRANFG
jgi:hypothetical protein